MPSGPCCCYEGAGSKGEWMLGGVVVLAATIPARAGSLLWYAVLGTAAGAIKSAQRTSPRAAARDVLTSAAGGAFTAFMAGAAATEYFGEERFLLCLVFSGLVGWIGVAAVDWASHILEVAAAKKMMQAPPPPDTPAPPAAPPAQPPKGTS